MVTLEAQSGDIPPAQIANLKTINLKALKVQRPNEVAKLITAAQEDGIFYLDLADDDETQLSSATQDIAELSRSLFDMSGEQKMNFDIDKLGKYKLNGYKPIGRNVGGIRGQRDGFESYAISRNWMWSTADGQIDHPTVIEKNKESVTNFASRCLDMAHVILETLSEAFQLPSHTSFDSCHHYSQSSLDILRLLRYPGAIGSDLFSVPQIAHTDMGSLTFLFTTSPGLQIQPSGSKEWKYVMPKLGQPVVNLGDAMKILSNGHLQSVLHRVVSTNGEESEDRYSFAFLMRPEPSTVMAPLATFKSHFQQKEPVFTCEEWVSQKFRALRHV